MSTNKNNKEVINNQSNVQNKLIQQRLPKRVCIKAAILRKRNPSIENFAQWASDPSHIYIGRNMSFYVEGALASKWKNPYKLVNNRGQGYTLNESLQLYREYVINGPLKSQLRELLAYEELGCWCAEGAPCHGQVLIDLLNEELGQ